MAAKKKETIEIPMHLAKMLVSEPDDLKNPEDYKALQDVAKALLRVFMRMEE
jgi:hypothetical protein